ncbi:thioredoxin family protein [Tundrisphaera sp. TA3]|uniref:thioredoxin family protein n=1 Tax=Tundrisphaera sp. TA3 TaxID=3435775 RepID=UPI003EBC273C
MSRPDPDLAGTPTRAEVDAMAGPVLLEFGATWCGHCRQLAPQLAKALEAHPDVRHIKVEDGPGRPLGRSFRVTLWPTLVFLRDGMVVRQVARPSRPEVVAGLGEIDGSADS